ncbi:MAG TPA: hypothetical protein VE152_05505 [Acidimicrobiales bacterium]|jgi:hypothetical protein|nr:hypothetical protein [Acidimicrobiales bacterium]
MVTRYRHLLEPIVRGRVGVAVTVAALLVAAGIGGRAGVAVAVAWVLVSGSYCLANFWCCRETHCLVTGTGWTVLGLGTPAVLLISGGAVGWLRVDVVALAYLVVLGAGYGVEGLVAARTGRHFLGAGGNGAEAR